MGRYEDVFARSIEAPEEFWGRAAERIDWTKRWDRVLDDSNPPFYRWFPGGGLNTCYNCLDRHVEKGRADVTALIYDSPVTSTIERFTYRELRDRVALFAGVLVDLGVGKGDTVVVYMPMIPEAVVAMLACARIGAVHSVVFGGFAAHELAIRIDDARPKVLVTASGAIEGKKLLEYKPLVDRAFELAEHPPERCVVFQRPQVRASMVAGRDVDWREAVAAARPAACVPVRATDPLYILYTSGTTGRPKGVVRDNGGHAVALHWSMEAVYDVRPRDVFWAASDVGWVVGHSYIVYGPLLMGCTTILYEGKPVGTPDPGAFWRVVSQHGVRALFTAPTAIRAIKKEDPHGEHVAEHDLLDFKYLFLAGERLDPDTYHWARKILKRPVDRPLVADRDRLADRRQLHGDRATDHQAGLADGRRARLRRPHPRPPGPGHRAPPGGGGGGQAAAAAGHADHAMERRRALRLLLHRALPRLLLHQRRRLQGRGRLPLHHGPDR